MDERCIVICDSGIGGLRILKRLSHIYPKEKFLYFSDYKNLPYGEKTEDELFEILQKLYDKFLSFCPKLIIVACNTLSTVGVNFLRCKSVPIIGTFPKVGEGKGLLLCTTATANSQYVKGLKRKNPNLEIHEMPRLASQIEEWFKGGEKVDLKESFKGQSFEYDYVSLGCTHYPYVLDDLKKFFPKARFLSGESEIFEKIKGWVTTDDLTGGEGCVTFVGKDGLHLKKVYNSLKNRDF